MHGIYTSLKKLRRKLIQLLVDVVRVIGAGTIRLGAPKGIYHLLQDPKAYTLVVAGQESVPATPGSLRDLCGFKQDKQQPFPIFWAHLRHARLVGKGLAVLNDKKEMMVENLYGEVQYRSDPSYNYLHLPPAVHLKGPWTSIMSRWVRCDLSTFAHWMLDGLPRLALLDRFPDDTQILIPTPLLKSQLESLEILGVLDRCRATPEKHLVIEDYYYSSYTARQGCDDFYSIQFMRERFLAAGVDVPGTTDKIYISRRGATRAPLQEDEMIAFLESEGWTILRAELFTLRQQIGIFRQARMVCGTHGAGLVHLLWPKPGCKVLELSAKNYVNGSLESLALCCRHDHHFMLLPADKNFQVSLDMKEFKSAIHALGE